MALSGCALVLMSGAESASMLAGAGRHASMVTGLQMELGEGPCLQARASGVPVFVPDLAAAGANCWPAFARLRRRGGQGPIVKQAVSSAVESVPANTSIVVVSITQSRAAAFQ